MSVPYGVKLLYHSLNDYSMAFETAVPGQVAALVFLKSLCYIKIYRQLHFCTSTQSIIATNLFKNFRKYSRSETTPEIVEQTLIFLSRSRKDIMKKLDSFPTHKTGDLEYRAGHVLPYGATPRNDHSHFLSELFFYCQISVFFVVIVPDTPFHVAP